MQKGTGQADVIVVGGGPAGAGAAIGLVRQGFAVTLLDRARFPRDKACGEFLTPQAHRLLCELGAWDALTAAGANPVAATTLHAPDGTQTRHVPFNGKPAGYSVRRVTLDAVLLHTAQAAGVTVREGFAVRSLVRADDGTVCGVTGQNECGAPETVSAKAVIGADGSHSLVARQLKLVRPLPRLQRVAVVSHWHGVPGPNDAVEMRAAGPIVCGMGFPGPDNAANVTFVLPTPLASRLAGRPAEFIEETLQAHFPALHERLASARCETAIRTVGCFGHVCKPGIADGALLVGDAATFIDPFTGEGVYFALRGAQFAAEVLTDALHAGDVSATKLLRYPLLRRELTRRYLLCDLVQAVVRQPALLHQVVHRLKRSPDAADRLLSILGDTRPPAAILHPLLLWSLLVPHLAGA